MRILEFVLLIAVTILPFIKRQLLKKFAKKYLISIVCFIGLLHLVIDGWRWQMFLVYFLLVITLWRIYKINIEEKPRPTFIRVFGYAIVMLTNVLMWFLPVLLAVFSLPEPTGNYEVGSKWMHIKTDHEEQITQDSSDKRELMVKVWYPTNDISGIRREPYIDEANRIGFINKYSMGVLPPFTINYLDRIKTHVYPGAPISEETFPVLIFSPGYGSMSTGYYALLTEIASHGYIIVNVTHTYESLGATFPNGEKMFFDYTYQSKGDATSLEDIMSIKDAFEKDISFYERHNIIREASKDYFVTKIVDRWSNDLISVLDILDDYNNKGFFQNRMDLNKIAVFGHSRGGGAAGQTMLKDTRIKAAVNIDGVQWGQIMDTIFQKPFLFISADWPAEHEDINSHAYINKSTDYFYETKLLKSGHPNFMDIPLMIPIESIAGTGAIDAKLGLKITNELVVEFFNKHIKNDPNADVSKLKNKYELLEMNIYKGDSIK